MLVNIYNHVIQMMSVEAFYWCDSTEVPRIIFTMNSGTVFEIEFDNKEDRDKVFKELNNILDIKKL